MFHRLTDICGKTGLIALIATLSPAANAADPATQASSADPVASQSSAQASPSPLAPADEAPFRLMANLGSGIGFASGSGFSGTSAGPQLMAGALLSYDAQKWVFDAGLNWLYSQLSGPTSPVQSADIRTRAGMAEVSPRYRLGERWQLGPVADVLYGTDTSFGPAVAAPSTNVFVGAKLAYEMPVGDFALRIFAQALTDVSIANRQVTMLNAGLQFGLPFGLGSPQQQTEEITTTAAAPAPTEEELPLPADVAVELEPTRVFFSTDSARVRPEAESVLEDVGSYLASHPDDWRSIEISGHADQRGSYLYNLRLSGSRALAVLAALSKKGADVSKMSVQAFSWLKPNDPHNNQEAWARNRRAVILFHDVVSPEVLREMLKPLTKGDGYGPEMD